MWTKFVNLQPQILAMMKDYNMKDPLKAAMETCDFKRREKEPGSR